jgi:hypothetical protein
MWPMRCGAIRREMPQQIDATDDRVLGSCLAFPVIGTSDNG